MPLRAYACTFAACALTAEGGVAIQIGDGIIALRVGDAADWILAIEPQKGEYHNETHFLTDEDVETRLAYCALPAGISGTAVCTDGMEGLCLDREAGKLFGPFFESLADTLRSATGSGPADVETAIVDYLQADSVNAETDDDKTLVLALTRISHTD